MSASRQAVVHVVDDDEAVRESLRALLSSVQLQAATYASAEAFLAAATPAMRGCLVLDVRMPGMSGLELQRLLKERGCGLPVIVITGHGDVTMAVRAMKAGAFDFIEKPFNEQDLLDRIHAGLVRNAEAEQDERQRQHAAERLAQLTPREREVLGWLVDGQPSKRIAVALGISEHTVDVHRFNVMRKTETHNLAELIRLSLLAGDGEPPGAAPAE
jgi:FixJ family two-component response regulator